MNDSNNWQDFCLLYYEQAISFAQYHLNKIKGTSAKWDERIDEEVIVVDAAIEALQKVFTNYDPVRGASVSTYLSRLVHNELVAELKRETKSLASLNDISQHQEAEYTLRNVASRIPEQAMENLKEKLRAAILQLSPIDQSILGFFIEDPHTFIERSVSSLGVTPNVVRVRKSRALKRLPDLMDMTSSDYFNLYEEQPVAGMSFMLQCTPAVRVYTNPIYPLFNLNATVQKLYQAIIGN